MREPPGDGVSPYLRFMPIVTQFQLALDMALSTADAGQATGIPTMRSDYIGPWVEVTAPEQLDRGRYRTRLKAHCDNGFQVGCTNDRR
jgi:uncharacterized membrane protein